MELFRAQATNAVNSLLDHSPFQEYRNYFNAFAISVASKQSGSDHPTDPSFRDTYFNSTYDDVSDYLVTIPPNFADPNYSHGQGKIDALLQAFVPQSHLAILLVNDLRTGGSDGSDKTAIASIAFSSPEILAHECGHVLANLGDEYSSPYPDFPDTKEPNTTRETRPDFIKWKTWISTNTPIPTPATAPYSEVIGLFEGAHYNAVGWYRPRLNCLMRSQGVPFCEVCREALVLSIYQHVRPADSFIPSATNIFLLTTQSVNFSVSVLQPATHKTNIQWFTNGAAMPGATNSSFTFLPGAAGGTTQFVSVVVQDLTPWVRNDPSNLLRQTIGWKIVVNLDQMQLDSTSRLPGNRFTFRVSGQAPQGFAIQTSTNLVNWISLLTNSLNAGQFWYTNSITTGTLGHFFRAVTPP